jgi:hypothetical protein
MAKRKIQGARNRPLRPGNHRGIAAVQARERVYD